MSKSYVKRLQIPLDGVVSIPFFTKSGVPVSKGYIRVVIGGRGPYVEFNEKQIIWDSFEMPEDQKYRLTNGVCYYLEYRSKDEAFVKLYLQKKTVSYADYKVGMIYISPFELIMRNKQPIII